MQGSAITYAIEILLQGYLVPNHYKLCLKAKSKRTVYTIKANSAQAAFLPKSIARLDSGFCSAQASAILRT
jgi:hypothetical protein